MPVEKKGAAIIGIIIKGLIMNVFGQEEDPELEALDPEEKVQKARDVTQARILTQEDFKKLRTRQLSKQLRPDAKGKGNKRQSSEAVVDLEGEGRCVEKRVQLHG